MAGYLVLVARLALGLPAKQQVEQLAVVELVVQFFYHPRISRMASYSLVKLFSLSVILVFKLAM